MSSTTVVGVVGSRRTGSYTRQAVGVVLEAVGDASASTDLIDLRDVDLPPFDPDRPDRGDAPELRARLRAADAVCLGTPVYHGSYASPLKTALDYSGFDEFDGTTVGLCCVAGGRFPVTALDHLRSVCRALDAWVLPLQVAVPRAREVFEDGRATDEEIADMLEALGSDLVEYAHIERDPETFESAENVGGD